MDMPFDRRNKTLIRSATTDDICIEINTLLRIFLAPAEMAQLVADDCERESRIVDGKEVTLTFFPVRLIPPFVDEIIHLLCDEGARRATAAKMSFLEIEEKYQPFLTPEEIARVGIYRPTRLRSRMHSSAYIQSSADVRGQ